MLWMATLTYEAEKEKVPIRPDSYCLDRPYDLYYLIPDVNDLSRELDFEFQHWRGPVRCFRRCHSTAVIDLPLSSRGF